MSYAPVIWTVTGVDTILLAYGKVVRLFCVRCTLQYPSRVSPCAFAFHALNS